MQSSEVNCSRKNLRRGVVDSRHCKPTSQNMGDYMCMYVCTALNIIIPLKNISKVEITNYVPAFIKQVFPRLYNPHCPGVANGSVKYELT